MTTNIMDKKEILILLQSFLFQGVVSMPPHENGEIKLKNINGETATIIQNNNSLIFRYQHFFDDNSIGQYNWELKNLDDLLTLLKRFSNSKLFVIQEDKMVKREIQ